MVRSLTALALLVAATPAAAQLSLATGETLLEVQAVGEASAGADVATMSLGVVSTGTTAKQATDANAVQMAAVIAALRRAGVEPRFIQTQQINLQPRFARMGPTDYQGQAEITGYVAQNSVSVMLNKLETAPDVISAGFAAGANSVNGPYLSRRDTTAVLAESRRDAIANARAEAQTYADGLGLKLARVLRVSDRGAYADQGQDGFFANAMPALRMAAAPAPVPVSGGEVRVRTTVWIDYALTPK